MVMEGSGYRTKKNGGWEGTGGGVGEEHEKATNQMLQARKGYRKVPGAASLCAGALRSAVVVVHVHYCPCMSAERWALPFPFVGIHRRPSYHDMNITNSPQGRTNLTIFDLLCRESNLYCSTGPVPVRSTAAWQPSCKRP